MEALRIYNTLRNESEDKAERISQLKKAGYLGTLRRFRREIEEFIRDGEQSPISGKQQSYGETWIKFVSVHDNLMELLDEDSDKDINVHAQSLV